MAGQATSRFPLNHATEALVPLLGIWDTVGAHGLIPGTVLHGRASFEWLEQGRLMLLRSRIHEDVGIPEGLAVLGSDDQSGAYTMAYSDERGVTRIYDVGIEDGGLRWWRNAPGFSQRYSLTFAADGTMAGKGELRRDGTTWEQDLDLTYTRVDP